MGWHKASVSDCLPLAAPIGLSPLLILTLCGSERVLVVSTEPPDDLSCLTTPGVGRPGDGAVPLAGCIQAGGGGSRQVKFAVGNFTEAPGFCVGPPAGVHKCVPLVCEKFAENSELRAGNVAANLKRDVKVPQTSPPPPVPLPTGAAAAPETRRTAAGGPAPSRARSC